jgi:hypothetical protein
MWLDDVIRTMMSTPRYHILVATHTKEEAGAFFKYFHCIPPHLATRIVTSPYYEMQLVNGAQVRIFYVSTRVPELGIAIRGQSANLIIACDFDDLNKEDQGSILAMKYRPDIELRKVKCKRIEN